VSLSKLVYLYAGWVRDKPAREALAALGVAVGVALVFATMTANRSIAGSADRIVDGLAGSAQIQASARGPSGVSRSSLRISHLPGVQQAVPLLEGPVAISHAGRTVSTQVVGAGIGVASINNLAETVPLTGGGLMLPAALASALNVPRGQPGGSTVTIFARGRVVRVRVQRVLGPEVLGELSHSLVAFGFLGYVQRLLGLPGRISNILVRAAPGDTALARRSLAGVVQPQMKVSSATSDRSLLREALRPQDLSSSFFALLGVLVGVLLVVTATMLTIADRRRELAELRLQGYSPRQLVVIVLFQGVILGAISSLVGVLAGYGLARGVLRATPDYLASAFPLGSGTTVSVPLAIGAWIAGVALTCVCVSPVLLDRSGWAEGRTIGTQTRRWMLAGAVGLVVLSIVAIAWAPLAAALLLVVAIPLCMPAVLAGVVSVLERFATGSRSRWLALAVGSVRATQLRAIALAATAAIGVFAVVVAEGAHGDLLRGLEGGYDRYVASADIWVTSPMDDLATSPFPAGRLTARIARVPGVTSVRPYYGGWIDMNGRRVWLISRSAAGLIPGAQVIRGNAKLAHQRFLSGNWIAISDQLAHTIGVHIGGTVSIPTPSGPERFRVAATTTNLGWSSGVVFLPARDYTQYWAAAPAALEVDTTPTMRAVALANIRHIVGPGLSVQTSAQRAGQADALPRQGLERLSEIAWLLVVAATVAIALAMGASIWPRRGELASLRLQSFTPRQVQAILAWEAVLVMGSGGVLGILAGVYGHIAADGYLRLSTGYPVIWALGVPTLASVVLLVTVVTAMILAAPGYIAARAPLRLALDGR
jgi:putative ABC transport system permease protein